MHTFAPRRFLTNCKHVGLFSALCATFAGCEPAMPEDLEALDSSLNNGTSTTTLFPEVVQIQIIVKKSTNWLGQTTITYGNCTATAIADDLLITASHCVKKEGTEVADYVQIITANADNASADNAYSSYIVMSKDIYENIDSDGNNTLYNDRDFAFIKFGKNTFSKYLDFTYKTDKVNVNDTLTAIGFGDQTTKAYGSAKVTSRSTPTSTTGYGYFYTESDSAISGQGVTEHGDSGGPLLYKENGKYYVVGVLFGGSTSGTVKSSKYPALTPAVYNHISTFLTSRSKYCVETWKDANYSGDSLAICIDSAISSDLEAQGFSDPFNMYKKWNYGDWNDEITSLYIPTNMSATFYQSYSGGVGTGDSMTLVNAFPFLSNTNIPTVSPYDFNDRISAFSIEYNSSPTVSFKNAGTGKCLDLAGGQLIDGAKIQQWSCIEGINNQVFSLVSTTTSNVYQLKNKTSGKCVNLSGGATANGTQIQQYTCDSNNTDNLWKLETLGTAGKFHIVHPASGKCLDLNAGGSADGQKIQLWDCLASTSSIVDHQQFTFLRY